MRASVEHNAGRATVLIVIALHPPGAFLPAGFTTRAPERGSRDVTDNPGGSESD